MGISRAGGIGRIVPIAIALWFVLFSFVAGPVVRATGSPSVVWLHQFGIAGDDRAYGLASDDTGLYVGGTTDWAFSGYGNEGANDAFVRKYDPGGNEVWTRQFGTSEIDEVTGVSATGSAVYVAGFTDGAFEGQVNAGFRDSFVRKYDPDGNALWTRQFGSPATDFAKGVAADATGVYVAGSTYDALPGQTYLGLTDAYARKYDPDGNELWTRQFGTSTPDEAWAISANGTGVYVAGITWGDLPGYTNAGSDDAFVRRYTADGTEVWTRQFGTAGQDWALAVGADASGVYVTGQTAGAFPGYTNAGWTDVFVRRYDADGTEAWTRQFGTPNIDRPFAALATGTGAVVAGDIDSIEYSTYAGDAFARKYDASGAEVWTVRFGTVNSDGALGLATAPSGVYVAGVTFGIFPDSSSLGLPDAFVAKLGTEVTTAPCPLSHGYWKNHEGAWPVDALLLGAESYDANRLLNLLRMPPRGDASVILARQLIAAKLNLANGSDADPIAATVAEADAVLSAVGGRLPLGVPTSTANGRTMTSLSETLDEYNNGRLTPGCASPGDRGSDPGGTADGPGTLQGGTDLPDDGGVGGSHSEGLWAVAGSFVALVVGASAVAFNRRTRAGRR